MTIKDDLIALQRKLDLDANDNMAAVQRIIDELAAPPPPPGPRDLKAPFGWYPSYGNANGLNQWNILSTLLGRPGKYLLQMGDKVNANDFESSVWGFTIGTPGGNLGSLAKTVTLIVTVPVAFGPQVDLVNNRNAGVAQIGKALAVTLAGTNDAAYLRAFRYIQMAGFGNVIMRSSESDGTWEPYSSSGNESQYGAALRHVADLFRSVFPTGKVDYCGTLGYNAQLVKAMPTTFKPDILGLDVYDKGTTLGAVQAGMTTHFASAIKASIPAVSLPEWACTGGSQGNGDDPQFVNTVLDELGSLPAELTLAYYCWFNEDTADGAHRIQTFPKAQAALKARVA